MEEFARLQRVLDKCLKMVKDIEVYTKMNRELTASINEKVPEDFIKQTLLDMVELVKNDFITYIEATEDFIQILEELGSKKTHIFRRKLNEIRDKAEMLYHEACEKISKIDVNDPSKIHLTLIEIIATFNSDSNLSRELISEFFECITSF